MHCCLLLLWSPRCFSHGTMPFVRAPIHGTPFLLFASPSCPLVVFPSETPIFFSQKILASCVVSGVVGLPFGFNGHIFSCMYLCSH
ncbi:hypothetical protein MANES_04G058950v8 [Manihot esculenta]|uniref:Uncharacterized protein n=1 Tax=Manihot esculenta TaxID=3983 RepID=A0ACB7HTW4_MANES|nr:hypothetical protein MANES_04G058950v8 [Manihot esculenta]